MPPVTRSLLPTVQPVIVSGRSQPFSARGWLFEPKYDGFRGIFYLSRRGCAMFSRRGSHFRRFDELCRRIRAELPRGEAILDGEVVAIGPDGRVDFYGLMRYKIKNPGYSQAEGRGDLFERGRS